ncbi:hypothetical protein FE392_05235 [Xenorhabdus sp. 12]|uniref:Uncharacterized protein n=1 Tax=Xenorhabdus santafensis TaxID=2582833 RepID=A0ABU4S6B6_9GAMM|nr:hypothetical protein [Xenorhabdus sp. 12]MDX7986739.1 hypothetical protein [Xenorhabdus sp. 12]
MIKERCLRDQVIQTFFQITVYLLALFMGGKPWGRTIHSDKYATPLLFFAVVLYLEIHWVYRFVSKGQIALASRLANLFYNRVFR